MLRTLHIENIALIDTVELEFGDGFNVLTGETGAGKSIIIDSVNFVLGERASRELIKHGCSRARVEALFDITDCDRARDILASQEIDAEDNELILSREITAAGKSSCRINGVLVPVATLKSVSDALIDIHGQHEHQSLLSSERHTDFLDAYANAATGPLLGAIDALCTEFARLTRERHAGFGTEAERRRETDMLSYQIREIEEANLIPGEEETLSSEKLMLMNAERISEALGEAHAALAGEDSSNGLSALDGARRRLREIASFSKEYEAALTRLEEAYYTVEDVAFTLRDARDGVEFDEEKLEATEERLRRIADLKRKYGASIEDVLEFAKTAAERLDKLNRADERAAELDERLSALRSDYAKLDGRLGDARREAAEALRKAVLVHMADLGLDKAEFSVDFTSEGDASPRSGGALRAEFMLSANPGEPLKPLARVASGGELSRIMLCFKAIFADNDSIGTLIFDEIDTGISGRVASVVGEKMLGIASRHQVVCVTHLPQIAALADRHYLVEKHDDGSVTHVDVRLLDDEGKNIRIAQMMDGSADSKYALEHARVLIERAKQLKGKP